jgi:hypothetical protein
MLRNLRPRLTYANVMVTLLAFVVLGGGAYAANEWNGSNIQDGTLTGADIQDLSLGLPDYGANSISTGKLKDQDVRTQDLRDLGVTNSKIAWDSVSSGKVIDNNLTGEDVNEASLNVPVVAKLTGSTTTATIQCDQGMKAVGGGGFAGAGALKLSLPVNSSGDLLDPGDTATGWRATAVTSGALVEADVLCVR